MPEAAIRIENLTRDFNSIKAVDGISLEVPRGTIFGFLGPNGAGKTTTINLLLGLLEPTAGRAEVLGFDTKTQADSIRTQTGALLEHSGLYEQMSAEDNLEFYGRVYRLPDTERRSRIKEILTQMKLWERRGERVGVWSKGMKQKLALARALMQYPPLIFLDEPTAGLDVVSSAEVRDDLKSLASSKGITVFLTTHNMMEAEKLCEQVAVIRQGKLMAVGQLDELQRQTGNPQVEVSGSGFNDDVLDLLRSRPEVAEASVENNRLRIELGAETGVAPLVNLLVGAGVQIEEVHKGKASLEEVFLTLMRESQ